MVIYYGQERKETKRRKNSQPNTLLNVDYLDDEGETKPNTHTKQTVVMMIIPGEENETNRNGYGVYFFFFFAERIRNEMKLILIKLNIFLFLLWFLSFLVV